MTSHELIQANRLAPHDRILVPTSGHAGSSADCLVEVLRVVGRERPVLWIRGRDGRTSMYVPGRLVDRVQICPEVPMRAGQRPENG